MNETSENPYISPVDQGQKFPATQSKVVTRILSWGLSFIIIGILIAMLMPATRRVPEAARRTACSNNLKQLALAVHNYESVNGHLPPAYTVDDQGQPLHSWRTLILPFLEQIELFESIDLSKPWNDPANEHARSKTPDCYKCPTVNLKPGFTTYLANVGDKGALVPDKGRLLKEFVDGTANTVFFFEVNADQAVEWLSPQDGDYETLMATVRASKGPHPGVVNVVMVDASTKTVPFGLSDETSLLPFFTIADQDKAEWPE